jgi:hypothetical protein
MADSIREILLTAGGLMKQGRFWAFIQELHA